MSNSMTLTQSPCRLCNTLVAQRTYVYDAAARPTERSIARNGTTRNDVYTYNDRNESPRRLVGGLDKHEVFAPQGRVPNGVGTSQLISDVVDGTGLNGWDYDNIGNRLMEHRNDGYEVYTSNELNQYTAVTEPGGTFTPAYV